MSASMLPIPAPILPKGYEKQPVLNKKVYSKYREMLGTYNDKANAIIQSLPSYMVSEDRGFNLHSSNTSESSDDSVDGPRQTQ